MRILHVVGGLNRGGAETWLVQVLRNIDRGRYQMDFLVHTEEPCAYDEEVKSLGSRIIMCFHPSNPAAYAFNFRRVLRTYGPYDCVHSHVHHFSGYVMMLAAMAGIPIRIAHSHLDTAAIDSQAPFTRRLYLALMRKAIAKLATTGAAVSMLAADSLFPLKWRSDKRWMISQLGIDLEPFRHKVDSKLQRQSLGIPDGSVVVGHVGRFAEQKNHKFFVQIAIRALDLDSRLFFLLVGDGPLRPSIEAAVKEAGLSNRFLFTGVRGDIPALMLGAMDVMLFPSLYEGLGLILIEAQAAGLPSLISDTIPHEADLLPDLIYREELSRTATQWASKLCVLLNGHERLLSRVLNSAIREYSIEESVKKLAGIYDQRLGRTR